MEKDDGSALAVLLQEAEKANYLLIDQCDNGIWKRFSRKTV